MLDMAVVRFSFLHFGCDMGEKRSVDLVVVSILIFLNFILAVFYRKSDPFGVAH